MNEQDFLKDLLCVLVLYNIPLEKSETFISLTESLIDIKGKGNIVIYDNSPQSMYDRKPNEYWDIIYIHDPSNPGISKAYNEGAKLAIRLGLKYLLLLDQDTKFEVAAIKMYCNSIFQFQREQVFIPILYSSTGRILSPSIYLIKRSFLWKKPIAGINNFINRSFINSGILINIVAFKKVGGYNEKIPLYFSDCFFVDKLATHYDTFVIAQVTGEHQMNVSNGASLPTFMLYCHGVLNYIKAQKSIFNKIIIFMPCIIRSLKLSFKYKKKDYIIMVYNTFFKY